MAVSTWGYKNTNGPATWALDYPEAAGSGQSPVDIATKDTIYDADLTNLKISYVQEDGFDAENNGLSFKVNIAKKSELSGGPLGKNIYRLEQFHLHWGSHDNQGSEHTIDGQSYAAELHLVHYNSSKYSSFSEAVNKPDGLAVLGIMIQAGSENKGFKVLSETARSIKSKQKCHVATTFNPECLLPQNTKDFWTYHGSLTTPPCYESVQWIVLKDSVQYSPQQVFSSYSGKKLHPSNSENGTTPRFDSYSSELFVWKKLTMSTTSSVTYMVIGLAIMIKILIWCCVLYKRQERRRQLLQTQQIVASVNVPTAGQNQPYGPYPNYTYPPQTYGIDNPGMIGTNPPAYNEVFTNYNEPKLPTYDEVVSDPNKYQEGPKTDMPSTNQ